MSNEIYIAILVASACILLLTVAFFATALYFKARVAAVESKVTHPDSDLSVLVEESQEFISRMKQLAATGNGVMEDIRQMTHTTRMWCDRADRVVDAVSTATEPSMDFMSKNLRFGGGFLGGIMHDVLTRNKDHSLNRSLDMSDCNNGSSSTQIMAAFGAGALIGAGVAVLFAPQSGKETRDQIASKSKETRDHVVKKSHDLKDGADDVIERGRHLVNEVKNETREAFEKGKQTARETSGV